MGAKHLIKVIKHGNRFKETTHQCEKCNFIFSYDDNYRRTQKVDIYGNKYLEYTIQCPECGNITITGIFVFDEVSE